MVGEDRDIYYSALSSKLFSSQQSSDRIIDQVAAMLGCADRSELGIVAGPRGLVAGRLILLPPSGQGEVNCEGGTPTLIPTEINADTWRATLPCSAEQAACEGHTVLVVEKEAVFKHLIQQPLAKGTVLVTGKGYPDLATRALVKLLASRASCERGARLGVVGMFDSDPYGIDIHRQYVQACGGVEWVGVDLEDFLPTAQDDAGAGRLVQLRTDERAKAVRLLRTLNHHTTHDELWR